MMTPMASGTMRAAGPVSAASVAAGLRAFGGLEGSQRVCQFLMRRSQILQQFHLAVEVNDESAVAIFADHLIKKAAAGAALLIEHTALAPASVDKEPERQRKVGLATEVMNGLRTAVLSESEVFFAQIVDDFPVLVSDGSQNIYHIYLDRDSGGIRRFPVGMASWGLRRGILGQGTTG